ncbi:PhzF family phenazine biosynthesis protein [Kocuria coralli]|uniref:PhzF family phenazine biosynthesis protein n=1 Tax=Kocuria coralli TaxID=1461025 RepID=A0A5J5KXM2_9MICC|nr:PhzF family phenazine biosynthesis protein [Kocuria coralli]KAA9394262.1 PhzF family phenazine biosynthesis protein [Kocuria coralli]
MAVHEFSQVDVFSSSPHRGNPVAVVHDADRITDEQMARFANWTNLSETTFLQTPTTENADYRLRIFTPDEELPFAGHPTLGSARAWLEAGGVPRTPGQVVQECEAGLITILLDDDGLAFAAPPLIRSGEADSDTLARAMEVLNLKPGQIEASHWVDNGPGWLGLVLRDARAVLDVVPDPESFARHDLRIGLLGAHDPARRAPGSPDVEVRALISMGGSVREDPVTGSLNAGFATWLIPAGLAPEEYLAAQGTVLGRAGRVSVRSDGEQIWVGGQTSVAIHGVAHF